MASSRPSKLHPEEAKLYGVLIMFFGWVLIFLGAVMVTTAGYESLRESSSALALLWSGVAIAMYGRAVRRTLYLGQNLPLYFLGLLLGMASLFATLGALSRQSVPSAIAAIAVQIVSIFLVWRAVTPKRKFDGA